MAKPISRVTLFNLPEEDVDELLRMFAALKRDAKKDGAPYLLAVSACRTYEDPRSQGYNVCARMGFASVEDMNYYDNQCEAHKAIKSFAGPRHKGIVMVYMDAEGPLGFN